MGFFSIFFSSPSSSSWVCPNPIQHILSFPRAKTQKKKKKEQMVEMPIFQCNQLTDDVSQGIGGDRKAWVSMWPLFCRSPGLFALAHATPGAMSGQFTNFWGWLSSSLNSQVSTLFFSPSSLFPRPVQTPLWVFHPGSSLPRCSSLFSSLPTQNHAALLCGLLLLLLITITTYY